jgi:hypothetical protein
MGFCTDNAKGMKEERATVPGTAGELFYFLHFAYVPGGDGVLVYYCLY